MYEKYLSWVDIYRAYDNLAPIASSGHVDFIPLLQ